jgi:ankyrin repeat protein
MVAAAALAVTGVPSAAQQFSNSFTFLKAVKERDGNKVTDLTANPGSSIVVNSKELSTGNSALHIVATGRDLTWLSFLMARGARVDQQNLKGETPLAIAAQLGWFEGAELLLSRQASVDLPNSRGETPLILAVQRRDVPMVRLLLARGANPKRTDSVAGYSALDYAKQDRRAAAVLKLLEAPAPKPAKEAAGPKL